ncbi:peroxidase 1-like [Impatiens glandulifera]|uniref:peroxidase 1-like n=1 Tax=Impatiens glandulifera TaxID=253017 RepID=UPI001FB17B23|nr:peroxidase 1-like [Impatiens glandulifera]
MLVMILPSIISSAENNVLSLNYYQNSCPHAEDIIAKAVIRHPDLAPGLIRLPFHDCFVNGCDASVTLDSTPSGRRVEKDSGVNLPFLNGLNVIDEAKAELEAECPETVSCADIIQYAARDAVLIAGQGLLESDQVLNLDPRTANIVNKMASPKGRWKEEKFAKAMIKMGKIELKTGTQGEIRKQCTRVNFQKHI